MKIVTNELSKSHAPNINVDNLQIRMESKNQLEAPEMAWGYLCGKKIIVKIIRLIAASNIDILHL